MGAIDMTRHNNTRGEVMKVTTHEMIMGEHQVNTVDVPDGHVNVFGCATGSRHYTDEWLPEVEAVALLGRCPWLRSKTHNAQGSKANTRGAE